MKTHMDSVKIELIRWLSTLEDKAMLNRIMDLKTTQSSDWWDEIGTEEKESIEKGLSDAEEGKLHPNDAAKMIYGKWL